MKDSIHIEVNPAVLKWARESIALNKTKACESSGLTAKRLQQLEDGEKQPTLEELKKLAKTYKRTIATLLLKKQPKEKPLPKDCRTIDSKDHGKFNEKTLVAIRKARALVQSLVELKQDAGFAIEPFRYSATMQTSAATLAQTLRREWGISEISEIENHNHAFEAYVEKVESLGVAVFQLSLAQDNLRGFSITDEIIPIIGIKRSGENATGKIFTLFHELGHVILNQGGLCDITLSPDSIKIEKWCNTFAAEILMPSEELLNTALIREQAITGKKEWSKMDLIAVGKKFHVGPLAVLRCLLEKKLTSPTFYKEKHESWNKPGFGRAKKSEGRNIAKEAFKEKGRTYVSLAFKAFDQNRIDLKDLSDFLGVRLAYISKTRQLLNI